MIGEGPIFQTNSNPMTTHCTAICLFLLLAANPLTAAETGSLAKELEALRPFLGRTWRGEFKNSTPEKPVVDIARWERVLNGQAIRVLHSVNHGDYGGESIIRWDKEKKTIVYYYFTTAGFTTTGTMTFTDGKLTSYEKVSGNANGISEVRGTSELRPDGTMFSSAEYLKNGQWAPGREVVYKEDMKAEVRFK
jgi:hypothetical protein